MAHRVFTDATGREWLVWDVVPHAAERRDGGSDRRSMGETEVRGGSHLPEAFAEGWLCFESGDEKRRLGPVPARWEHRPEWELETLLEQAAPASARDGRPDTSKMRAMTRETSNQRA